MSLIEHYAAYENVAKHMDEYGKAWEESSVKYWRAIEEGNTKSADKHWAECDKAWRNLEAISKTVVRDGYPHRVAPFLTVRVAKTSLKLHAEPSEHELTKAFRRANS